MLVKSLRLNIHQLYRVDPKTKDLSAVVAEFDIEVMDEQGNVIGVAPVKLQGKIGGPDQQDSDYYKNVELL